MATRGDVRGETLDPARRVLAFDLARGLAVAFMILIHVLRHWGDPATWTTPIGTVVSFLGGPPAAPVFMFLMGASLAFSRRTSFNALARRGVLLIAAGYLLNLARGTLPLSAGLATGVVTPEEVAPFTPLSLLWMVDILQLAGCSLILMAALREVVPVGPPWLLVAAAVVLVAPLLQSVTTGIPIVDGLLGMLWATADNVYYPVFPWAVFPLVGAVIGNAMVPARDRPMVLRRAGVVALAACVAGVAVIIATSTTLDDRTYWRLPPILVPAILGFVVAWLWACDVAVRAAGQRFGFPVLYDWGARVTSMYVIHWLIVTWGVAIVGFRVMDLGPVLGAMAAVLVATVVASRWRLRLPGTFTSSEAPSVRHAEVVGP